MKLKAVIFDVDGVITDTATIHFKCWKQVFDEFLLQYAKNKKIKFAPFTQDDYFKYVDGVSRIKGIEDFLQSRHITLPSSTTSISKLANRKNELFLQLIKKDGVRTFPSTIALIKALKKNNIKVAAISASRNCKQVLSLANVKGFFDIIIDGVLAKKLKLPSKPNPATFLEAAKRLKIKPKAAIIIEDALAGIQAAKLGHFGFAIAIDRRQKQIDQFKDLGANYIVNDLSDINYQNLANLFDKLSSSIVIKNNMLWNFTYNNYKPYQEKFREALCTLSNGYIATRGAAEEAKANQFHYPGTYFAGCYNRLNQKIDNKILFTEDLVNMPNWLCLTFRINNSTSWFDLKHCKILDYQKTLCLQQGILKRVIRFADNQNHITQITFSRFISMRNSHIAGLQFSIKAENWSGKITIKSGLDGNIRNSGVARYLKFNNKHLEPVDINAYSQAVFYIIMRTNQSDIVITELAKHQLFKNHQLLNSEPKLLKNKGSIYQYYDCPINSQELITLEKIVAFATSKDSFINQPLHDAIILISHNTNYEQLLNEHIRAWKHIWQYADIIILGHVKEQQTIRLHLFHLLQTFTKHSSDLDVGIPARGLHGEDYQGHIFWDELFILPFYIFHFPNIARAILLYRYRRLNMARYLANQRGFKGAMYPWQSSSNGEDVTPPVNLNPYSNHWDPDYSYYQYHVNAAIVYNIWQYYLATDDISFMLEYGAEIILEIARFWFSASIYNHKIKRYEIINVIGPDEFHEKYPNAKTPGLKNNAYTNIMAVWSIERALKILKLLISLKQPSLISQLQISKDEIKNWEDFTKKIFIPFHDKYIISQFEGYELLAELDWKYYRKKYKNIRRLDLILKAENNTPDNYKVAKQADVLMLFYLLPKSELKRIFKTLGYRFTNNMLVKNIEYYAKRTSHGSTLSKLVFSAVYFDINESIALNYYRQDLYSDLTYMEHSVTHEGIHLGAMGGCVNYIMQRFAGMQIKKNRLSFHPKLPSKLKQIEFKLVFHNNWYTLIIKHDSLRIKVDAIKKDGIKFYCNKHLYQLTSHQWLSIQLL